MPAKATKFTTAGSRNHTNLEEKQWYIILNIERDIVISIVAERIADFSPSKQQSTLFRIHRIANELKANRQWTQKWQLLNDATLFSDEAVPKYPQKLAVRL